MHLHAYSDELLSPLDLIGNTRKVKSDALRGAFVHPHQRAILVCLWTTWKRPPGACIATTPSGGSSSACVNSSSAVIQCPYVQQSRTQNTDTRIPQVRPHRLLFFASRRNASHMACICNGPAPNKNAHVPSVQPDTMGSTKENTHYTQRDPSLGGGGRQMVIKTIGVFPLHEFATHIAYYAVYVFYFKVQYEDWYHPLASVCHACVWTTSCSMSPKKHSMCFIFRFSFVFLVSWKQKYLMPNMRRICVEPFSHTHSFKNALPLCSVCLLFSCFFFPANAHAGTTP